MTIFGALSALLCLAFLIFWHELGHFIVARICGVGVERFSVGFGKPLVQWRDKYQTEFCLAWIPLGGYVRMYGEHTPLQAEASNVHFCGGSFEQARTWHKLCIVLAGPMANVLLAWILLIPINMLGTTLVVPVLQQPATQSVAFQAGFQATDRLVAIDDTQVTSWRDVELALIERIGDSGIITIDYVPGTGDIDISYNASSRSTLATHRTRIAIDNWLSDSVLPSPSATLGLLPWQPIIEARIATVQMHSAAEKAGLMAGDLVLQVNDVSIDSWSSFVTQVRQHPAKVMSLRIERDSRQFIIELRPQSRVADEGKLIGFAGVTTQPIEYPQHLLVNKRYGFFQSLGIATVETVEMMQFVWLSIVKLFNGSIDFRNVSGPVGIVKVAADSAENGLRSVLFFSAYISMSLAFMNILPVPVLDGGQALFIILEKILGRPIRLVWRLWAMRVSVFLLLSCMIAATFNDLLLW